MIRVAVVGASGRMGRLVLAEVLDAPDLELAAALVHRDPGADVGVLAGRAPCGLATTTLGPGCLAEARVVIDFSSPPALMAVVPLLEGRALVSGTTGLTAEERGTVLGYGARGPVLLAANFSAGVNALLALVEAAARALPDADIEIVEAHHHHKVDAPSGTALALGRAAAAARGVRLEDVAVHGRSGQVGARPSGQIGLHALRAGDITGEHQVWLAWQGERIQLTHMAHARSVFASGAVRAARWIAGRSPGVFDMRSVLGLP